MAKLRDYRELSKGGIVTLVVLSVLGGYIIAHPLERTFEPLRLLATLVGILLLASGSSALNHIQDAAMDARMERTRKRPIPGGVITERQAALFVILTCGAGLTLLYGIDPVLWGMGVAALFSYNVLYTLWWKRHWAYAAVPGSIPGALPIWMGAIAAHRSLTDPVGIYLFCVLVLWQMPHFWALAIRFAQDYRAGGVPTLPVVHGVEVTVRQITAWAIGYMALLLGAPLFLQTGRIYLGILIPTCGLIAWQLYRFASARKAERESKAWLPFFLWINFSLIFFLVAAAVDLWSVYAIAWWKA